MERPDPPVDWYESAWDWASANVSRHADVRQFYKSITDLDPSIVRHGPKGMDERYYKPLFDYHLRNMKPRKYVAILPGGRVCGRSGVISPDNKLIWDVSMDFFGAPEQHPVFSGQPLPPVTRIPGTAAVMTAPGSDNYYHWLVDVFPRFELLRRAPIRIDKYIMNVNGTIPFQNETLAALGISRKQLIESHDGTHYQADTLVVPAVLNTRTLMPGWALPVIRRELLTNRGITPIAGYERIYVSRLNAGHRRTENEQALIRILEGFGCRTVYMEQHSVADAARIFSSCDIVVAPHGAGLANLVFCRPGTKVVELFAPRYVNLCYWAISQHAGLDYHYLIGDGPQPGPVDPDTGSGLGGHDPISVNPVDLWLLLEKMQQSERKRFFNKRRSDGMTVKIAMKSYNGKYVCAEGGGGRELVANRTQLGPWETFQASFVDPWNNLVTLKTWDGSCYVGASADGRVYSVHAQSPGPEMTFKLEPRGGRQMSLKSSSGKYVCAEDGGGRELVANRGHCSIWETFEIEVL